MVGLQGAGKTTTAGKLALKVKKTMKKKPLLIAADVYRPAAVQQLKTLGKQLDIEVFYVDKDPVDIVKEGLAFAKENYFNYVIIDTAGRLHIDELLMDELKDIKAGMFETVFIGNSMTKVIDNKLVTPRGYNNE